jgi:ribosomal protein L9
VLSVKPGHARNHLVPAKLAAYATPERLAEAEAKRAEWVEDADAAGADDAVDRVRREKTSDVSRTRAPQIGTLPPAPEPRVAPGPDKRGDE